MDTRHQRYIIGGVLGLVAIAAIVSLLLGGSIFGGTKQEVSTDDPVDIVLDFYEPWLMAVKATNTNPYQLGLAKAPLLSEELKKKLLGAKKNTQEGIDPVLCHTAIPPNISARLVYQRDDSAQVLVMSTEKEAPEQAIITLLKYHDGWYINDIQCSPGEFDLPREFSFEREGYLLKSVPPPLDPQRWHLVFEENSQKGHVAPLFFDTESVCVSGDGQESVCSPDQLTEPLRVFIQGNMTELGLQVKRLELRE